MRYLPHTDDDIASMLETVGAKSLDELFQVIPDAYRTMDPLALPAPLTEWELDARMDQLASEMGDARKNKVYIGAGSYQHYIPQSVKYLLGRSEFSTAYTPYQPEISQGTLQGIFEYQTLVARLLGMDLANASMYDGASALAEALLMAIRVTKKTSVAISTAIHPHYREVVRTYFKPTEFEVIEMPFLDDGRTDLSSILDIKSLAAVAVQSPNFFGVIEDLKAIAALTKQDSKTLYITCFSEPLAYGFYRSPGSYGADIVCGEGQSFGIERSFGGPGLGIFACAQEYTRSVPGRLVGQTIDLDGKRGYVLTLATREQHIRREKATSNICSNQGLCALTAAMYLASLGGTGIKKLARLNFNKAEYLKRELISKGVRVRFDGPTFNEFVAEFPDGFEKTYEKLLTRGIVAGLRLDRYYPDLKNCSLLCVTETFSKAELDRLVKELTG